MKLTLWRRYEIEAAHQLTDGVPEGHRCRRLHGHRYVITLGVEGLVGADGMLIEYGDLDTQVRPILARIDHFSLNTLDSRDSTRAAKDCAINPTVELLCAWLVNALGYLQHDSNRVRLVAVRVEEDSAASLEWRAE